MPVPWIRTTHGRPELSGCSSTCARARWFAPTAIHRAAPGSSGRGSHPLANDSRRSRPAEVRTTLVSGSGRAPGVARGTRSGPSSIRAVRTARRRRRSHGAPIPQNAGGGSRRRIFIVERVQLVERDVERDRRRPTRGRDPEPVEAPAASRRGTGGEEARGPAHRARQPQETAGDRRTVGPAGSVRGVPGGGRSFGLCVSHRDATGESGVGRSLRCSGRGARGVGRRSRCRARS